MRFLTLVSFIMKQTRLIVFDWAGTLIDHGSRAPVETFVELFRIRGIQIGEAVAKGPMGLGKRDHIKTILSNLSVSEAWKNTFGEDPTDKDVDAIYGEYESIQIETIKKHSKVIHGAVDVVSFFRHQGIKVFGTTGYPRKVAEKVWQLAADQGLELDGNVCNCDVRVGRPSPFMLFRAMELANVYPSDNVLKVGDTVPDVLEAKHAGALAVSVLTTGTDWTGEVCRNRLKEQFISAGALDAIDSIADLPNWFKQRN